MAFYQQAEVQRPRGEYAAAEDSYQQASQWGLEPQPGLALLRLAQGRTDAAAAAIRRVVGETTGRLRRAKLLPAHVEIMLAVGDVQAARDAAKELAGIADRFDTPALPSVADHAQGAILLDDGAARAALVALRGAWQIWPRAGGAVRGRPSAAAGRARLPGAWGPRGGDDGAGCRPHHPCLLATRIGGLPRSQAAGRSLRSSQRHHQRGGRR